MLLKPSDLDTVLHERARLAVMSALFRVPSMTFTELRDRLEVSDGNLSVHSRVLEKAGFLNIDKDFVDRKPRTTLALTPDGKKAFWKYIGLLEKLVNSF